MKLKLKFDMDDYDVRRAATMAIKGADAYRVLSDLQDWLYRWGETNQLPEDWRDGDPDLRAVPYGQLREAISSLMADRYVDLREVDL